MSKAEGEISPDTSWAEAEGRKRSAASRATSTRLVVLVVSMSVVMTSNVRTLSLAVESRIETYPV